MKNRYRKSAFDLWWENARRPNVVDVTPYEAAKLAFEAGRASVPKSSKLRKALAGLLEMLEDWNAGFDGFGEVEAAKKAISHHKKVR